MPLCDSSCHSLSQMQMFPCRVNQSRRYGRPVANFTPCLLNCSTSVRLMPLYICLYSCPRNKVFPNNSSSPQNLRRYATAVFEAWPEYIKCEHAGEVQVRTKHGLERVERWSNMKYNKIKYDVTSIKTVSLNLALRSVFRTLGPQRTRYD